MDKLKLKQMKKAYSRQMSNAKQRKIKWLFNFEEWRYMWESSGKWEQRGRLKHQYVMCRYNDEGAYSFYNTRIDTVANNAREAAEIQFKNHEYKEYVRVKEGRGRPVDTGKVTVINGKTYRSLQSAADDLNLKRTTLLYRLSKGYYN